MASRRRRTFLALLVVAALASGFAIYRDGRHGRRVFADRMTNHESDFDFGAPPCGPAAKPASADLRIAYLGVGGLLIEWRGSMLATAPYYTRQGLFEVMLGNVRIDTDAIAHGVGDFDPGSWDVLLSAHSHYDHLADVPELMLRHATGATLWTNRSGAHMLGAYPEIEHRVRSINDEVGTWIRLEKSDESLPFKMLPLTSAHAPHLYGLAFAHGTVDERWSSWDGRNTRAMRDGLTASFLIDLLDETGETVFRIFFQDSASPAGIGHPPTEWIDERAADLAVICIPPYWQVEDYPEGVLESTAARYVMTIHYEDFFRPAEEPIRFVQSLTDARVDTLLERVENATRGRAAPLPVTAICGPSGDRWAMPLPGEWLGFDVPDDAVLTSEP